MPENRSSGGNFIQLDYISASTTSYINTGYIPNLKTRVVADMEITFSKKWDHFFGSDSFLKMQWNDNATTINVEARCYKGEFDAVTELTGLNISQKRVVFDINLQSTTMYMNGVAYTINHGTATSTIYPLLIFGGWYDENIEPHMSGGKLYSFKIYEAGSVVGEYVPIQDLVPALDGNNNICLYDTINGTMKYSSDGNITSNPKSLFASYISSDKNTFPDMNGFAYTYTQIEDITTGNIKYFLYTDSTIHLPTKVSFKDKSNLLELTSLISTNITDMNDMFNGCSKLTSICELNTSKVTGMKNMFAGCEKLTNLNNIINKFNTSNITDMTCMFKNCKSVASLNLASFNTSKVTNMNSMFAGCESLTTLNINNFNTSNVENMQLMFQDCKALTVLDVSKFDLNKVKYTNAMFERCHKIKTLNVSNWNTGNIINADYMFNECKELGTLDVSNWNTQNIKSIDCMFKRCENLSTIDVSNWDTRNMNVIGQAFSFCRNVTELDVSNWNIDNVDSLYLLFNECYLIEELDLSKWNTSNVKNMYGAFADCKNLKRLDVSTFDVSNVTNFEYTFHGLESLEELNISTWKPTSVNNYGNMFGGSFNQLSSVKLLNSDDYFISIISICLPTIINNEPAILNITDSSNINLNNYNVIKEKNWHLYYRTNKTIIVRRFGNKYNFYGYTNNKLISSF